MFTREQQQRLLHSPNCGRCAFALSVRSRVSIWVLAYSRIVPSIRDSGEFSGCPAQARPAVSGRDEFVIRDVSTVSDCLSNDEDNCEIVVLRDCGTRQSMCR